jgi:hypothetical protein
MHKPKNKKIGREVKIEEGWMLKKRSALIWAPGVSIGCADFLEDVKMHFVMQLLNARSQQKETWQAGQDRRNLDAAKEK